MLDTVLILLGGIGLFLYGMRLMGEGLERSAGDKLRYFLELLTKNRFLGVIMGTVVTAIIQSSGATTVMVVGLVNTGLMDITQAVGVIMGANIGTTVTAQIIAFNLKNLAMPSIAVGSLLFLFSKKNSGKYFGQIILGFGLLFFGMQTMEAALKPIALLPQFTNFLMSFSKNPFLGVISGFIATGVVQSSSATIGILQALAQQGAVNISIALPILFGDNIGSCVTALISSIGTNITARRAAVFHLAFNVVGTLIFLLIMPWVQWIVLQTSASPVRQIANAHTIFNLANTVIQFPFALLLVNLIKKLIPGEPEIIEHGVMFIDDRFLETPTLALTQVKKEIARMGELAQDSLRESMNTFLFFEADTAHKIREKEVVINNLARENTRYLALLSRQSFTAEDSDFITNMVSAVNDIERVGDHAVNILELAEVRNEDKLDLSNDATNGLVTMSSKVQEAFGLGISSFLNHDRIAAGKIITFEEEIDDLEKTLRYQHIRRLNEGICGPSSGVIYLDLLSNLERIGDHSFNLASYVLDIDKNYKDL